jgi:signal transduction histidine kinase
VGEAHSANPNDHVISFDLPEDLPHIYADHDKIAQILINLVSNALKYTPGGAITIGARAGAEWLEAWVADEGPGIDPEVRKRLFERFGAAGAAGVASTGLGLFLTRYLVEEHGGTIDVINPPAGAEKEKTAKGATFRFTLPLAQAN